VPLHGPLAPRSRSEIPGASLLATRAAQKPSVDSRLTPNQRALIEQARVRAALDDPGASDREPETLWAARLLAEAERTLARTATALVSLGPALAAFGPAGAGLAACRTAVEMICGRLASSARVVAAKVGYATGTDAIQALEREVCHADTVPENPLDPMTVASLLSLRADASDLGRQMTTQVDQLSRALRALPTSPERDVCAAALGEDGPLSEGALQLALLADPIAALCARARALDRAIARRVADGPKPRFSEDATGWPKRLLETALRAGLSAADVEAAKTRLLEVPITISFDAARNIAADGAAPLTAVAAFLRDGEYRDVFQTGTTGNFGQDGRNRSAKDQMRLRLDQEAKLFGTARRLEPDEHPIYATVDVFARREGGAPRYGRSYVVLAPNVRSRMTIGPASGQGPAVPPDRPEVLLQRNLRAVEVLSGTSVGLAAAESESGYGLLEAHVFGGVRFETDVIGIVADPALRGTPVEDELRALAARFAIPLEL
jgi:hypothetical protein